MNADQLKFLNNTMNTGLQGIAKQGQYSIKEPDNGYSCRYRFDETAECPIRCLIGHCIPDENYIPEMEGDMSKAVAVSMRGAGEIEITSLVIEVLRHMQQDLHDNPGKNGKPIHSLLNVAKEFISGWHHRGLELRLYPETIASLKAA
jgi:hypothetical protein